MDELKKRGKRTTSDQMAILIDYLENNKILITGKSHPMNTGEVENKWDELVELLNSTKNGAIKDKKQWKNVRYLQMPITCLDYCFFFSFYQSGNPNPERKQDC